MQFKLLAVIMLLGHIAKDAGTVSSKSFQQQCLDAHNLYRVRHGAIPLVLDKTLNNFAQQWTNHLININRLEHRSKSKYGENIYMTWSKPNINGATAVNAWYSEIKDYNFHSPAFSLKTSHFSQVIWKGSRRLGCAYARRGNTFYVVANYDPPGNIARQFSQNVRPGY